MRLCLLSETLPGGLPYEEDWDILEDDPAGDDAADDQSGTDDKGKGQEDDSGADDQSGTDTTPENPALAKALAELATLKKAAADRAAADEEARRKKAEEDGEFKSLYEKVQAEAKAQAERLAAFEAKETARADALKKANTKRHKALPKNLRSLISLDGDADAVAALLDKAEVAAKELAARPAGSEGGDANRAETTDIPAHIVKEAKNRGMDPAAWYAIVQQRAARLKRRTA